MAKNKNRKQAGPKNRSAETAETQEHTRRPAAEAHEAPISQVPAGPADSTRKKQKSFGHN